ncbi:hypothetical protein [Oryzomonas rubra]|uniref:hypothetical protein n=1 Tax=Oryzomonas rubra TaxID=2509454 RepID=UPI00165E7CBE|nr:hypothetical protein [Oryzomonas rubra]
MRVSLAAISMGVNVLDLSRNGAGHVLGQGDMQHNATVPGLDGVAVKQGLAVQRV